jgi:pyruvate-formate lyase-activating enzyme
VDHEPQLELGQVVQRCFDAATRAYYRDHFSGQPKDLALSFILTGTFLQCHWQHNGRLDVTVTVQGRLTQPTAVTFFRFQRGTAGGYTFSGGSLDL